LSNLIWDHPRSCGKDCNSTGRAISQVGSPPLTRERQIAATSRPDVVGITPAYAGKTFIIECDGKGLRDHPAYAGKTR